MAHNEMLTPVPYYIVPFDEIPQTIMDTYHGPQQVTRGNWNAYMIKSFAVSRGIINAQIAYNDWLRQRNGFDYVTSIYNFIDAGSWEILLPEERERFTHAFWNVKRHTRTLDESILQFLKDPQTELSCQLLNIISYKEEYEAKPETNIIKDLDLLETVENDTEFITFIKGHTRY